MHPFLGSHTSWENTTTQLATPTAILQGSVHSISGIPATTMPLDSLTYLATGTIRQYSHNPNDPSSLSNNDIKSSGEDREGRFWVATSGHLDEFHRRTGKVTRDISLQEAFSGFAFYEDRFGVFWIFMTPPCVIRVGPEDQHADPLSFQETEGPPALTVIMSLTEDRNGTPWLATHGAGLLKLDREHRRFIRYHNNPIDPTSPTDRNVENLFADKGRKHLG